MPWSISFPQEDVFSPSLRSRFPNKGDAWDKSQKFHLREGHAEELVPAIKAFDLVVAIVSLTIFLKFVNG